MNQTILKRYHFIFIAITVITIGVSTNVRTVKASPLQSYRKANDFTIIYPNGEGENSYAYNAACLLRQEIKEKTGDSLAIQPDTAALQPHEILVGETNRPKGSVIPGYTTSASDEYYLSVSDEAICLKGENQVIGSAVYHLVHDCMSDSGALSEAGYAAAGHTGFYQKAKTAKNIIYLISDGAGVNHFKWFKSTIGNGFFAGDKLPSQGYLYTDNSSHKTTDSAASGTALACGYKTSNGTLGQNEAHSVNYQNIRELCYSKGMANGVLTTDVITGATPAAFTVHTGSRNNTAEITTQQKKLMDKGRIQYCEGSLGADAVDKVRQDVTNLSNDPDGFFLMYEEAYTDKYSHVNNTSSMLQAVQRYEDIIYYVSVYAAYDPSTTLILTSDHETGGITKAPYTFTTTGHTSANVRIMSMGPGTEYFNGRTVENNCVPMLLAELMGNISLGNRTMYDGMNSIAITTVSGIKNQIYTGKAITQPELLVKRGTTTLKAGTDYTVAYHNNIKIGTATVTISGKGNYRGTISRTFKIIDPKAISVSVKASGYKYGFKTIVLKKGKTVTLKGTVSPGEVLQGVTFKSTNRKVATVSSKGKVKAKKTGTAKIKVLSKYKTKSKTITIKVVKKDKTNTKLTLSKKTLSVKKGKKVQIKIKSLAKGTTSKLTYKSRKKSTATVDKYGVVKGKKKGTTYVTVKCGKKSAKVKIKVK